MRAVVTARNLPRLHSSQVSVTSTPVSRFAMPCQQSRIRRHRGQARVRTLTPGAFPISPGVRAAAIACPSIQNEVYPRSSRTCTSLFEVASSFSQLTLSSLSSPITLLV